jgi:hypothetical protein
VSVTLWGLPIYIKKKYRKKAKEEELYGNLNISPCKNIIFKKNRLKETQNPSKYHNYVTNLKFQHKKKKKIEEKIDKFICDKSHPKSYIL